MARRQLARHASPRSDQSVEDGGESKSEQTRKRILDAAAHILSVKGYSGLRLTDVASVAEVQAPAIYYYYASREELIEEVMWTGTAETREHTVAALEVLPATSEPKDRLLTAVEAHLRHMLEISDYSKAAIRNAGQVPESIRKRQMREEEKYGELWRRLLSDLSRSGELRAEYDPYTAQMLMMGSLNWVLEWWDPRRSSVDSLVVNALAFVASALFGGQTARSKRSR